MDLQKVKEILVPYLEENSFKLYDISYVREAGMQILRVLVSKKDGINIDELNKVLANINNEFNKNVDDLFSEAKKNLAKAVEKLSDNLSMLEEEIITSADRIEEMKDSIKALGKDIREQKSTKEKLDVYKNILALIRENTYFINIDDMEEK